MDHYAEDNKFIFL